MAPKHPPISADEMTQRRASCRAIPTCRGQQRYSAAENLCLPPNCRARYFQVLDEERGVCTHRFSFQLLATVLIGGFAIAELVLQQCQLRFPREAEAAAEAD